MADEVDQPPELSGDIGQLPLPNPDDAMIWAIEQFCKHAADPSPLLSSRRARRLRRRIFNGEFSRG